MNQSDPLLKVENLKTQFFTETGTVHAVDGVSFEVREGELVGLVGESGAGKSVAAQSIMRLVEEPGRIVDGTVTFKGKKLIDIQQRPDGSLEESEAMLSAQEMRTEIRGTEIAIIFQDPMKSLNPVFTIGDQLKEFIELNRDVTDEEAKKIAVEMLREVGIPESERRYGEYPHQFSGGQRQRVLIAMALACEPSLIIADEPTTALDVTVEGQILDLVANLQEKYDTAFIWVTHDMGVVAEICDSVNVMYLGKIIEHAEVDDMFYDTKHPYTQALLRSIPRPDRTVESLDPISGMMPNAINPPSGCRFHTRCPEAREACREIEPEHRNIHGDGSMDTNDSAEQNDASTKRHVVSCLKYESVGYEYSEPLETTPTNAFAGGLTEMRAGRNDNE